MRNRIATLLAATSMVALLAGCGSQQKSVVSPGGSSGAGSSQDQSQVAGELANQPTFVEDGVYESPDQTTIDPAPAPGSKASPLAAIRPLRFWRDIRHVERSFEFAFSDTDTTGHPTTAVVTIHKLLSGTFNILTMTGTDSFRVVRKPLADHWVRRALLKRIQIPDDDRPVWKLVATSGIKVTSKDATTHIQSLEVQTTGFDSTVTDPLAFWRLRRIIKLDPGDSVTVTVTTQRNDDVVVWVFRDHRVRFHNNGDNTYTGVLRAPRLAGLYHLGVNALSNGTLYDDALPYDSQAWIIPIAVRPMELADYAP